MRTNGRQDVAHLPWSQDARCAAAEVNATDTFPARTTGYFRFQRIYVNRDIRFPAGAGDKRTVAAFAAAKRKVQVQGHRTGHGIIIAEPGAEAALIKYGRFSTLTY